MKTRSADILIVSILILTGMPGCLTRTDSPGHTRQRDSLVSADAETQSVNAAIGADAADDPAIWIHPEEPAKSLVIGTNKVAGLGVYNLQGEEIHFYPAGRVNNVDVRYGFEFGDGTKGDIIGCTERINNEILLFRIHPGSGSLSDISGGRLLSEKDQIYGFCMYYSRKTATYYALSNDKDGTIEQWALSPSGDHEVEGKIVRTMKLRSQPEGMVADDEMAYLYVGEEHRGIWKFHAEPGINDSPEFIMQSGSDNPEIAFDVEGLAIYPASSGKGYLIVSSQGNNSFALFEREAGNRYIGRFWIVDSLYDGVSDTDGIEVSNLELGPAFPGGMLVVQDGMNIDGTRWRTQNFKMVSWEKVARLFDPPLIIDPGYKGYIPER